jgi:alkanesulfonate monooxygenase SsuD/methylene tetrahydromethanopterin reductase-like flavin-dependent oxidoreductase (luciferase family)
MAIQLGVTVYGSIQADPVAVARRAEEQGFDFISTWDHLHSSDPGYETWTLLTWIASATSKLGLLTNVLGLPYRPPQVLAKMAESLQRLSGGRLMLGLGAGGSDQEFRAWGLPVRSRGEKIAALREAIEVIRGMWSKPHFSYHGRHYSTVEAEMEPKPETPIPIWLGVYKPRGLALVGELADGWIPSMPYAPPETAVGMRELIREAARKAGRDPEVIAYAYNVALRIGDRRPGRALSGEPEEIAEVLIDLVKKGFTAFNFWVSPERPEQMERLAGEVLPLVRKGI